jgi:hypothetical protein
LRTSRVQTRIAQALRVTFPTYRHANDPFCNSLAVTVAEVGRHRADGVKGSPMTRIASSSNESSRASTNERIVAIAFGLYPDPVPKRQSYAGPVSGDKGKS